MRNTLRLMRCCYDVVVAVALLVLAARPADSQDFSADVYILCNVRKYDNGSAFDRDLQAALTALMGEASVSSFAFYSAGSSVRAAYQCRGDLSLDVCSQCVFQASHTALSSCPDAIGARVQADGCFLRYENYSFTAPDSSVVLELCNVNKDRSPTFQSDVTDLLRTVTSTAPRQKGLFASADLSVNASTRLYALAQCLGYLSSDDCSHCLAAHSSSWHDCDSAVGAQVHSVDCYYRFEIYPFYDA